MFSRLAFSTLLISICSIAVLATNSVRADVVQGYGIDNSENLYLINLQTASTTYIGNTGVFLEGLALSHSGNLYGSGHNGNLYVIDRSSGASTLIGYTGYKDIEGLHFNGSKLLGAPSFLYPEIISIDKSNASSSLILTSPQISGGATAILVALH